MSLPLHGRGAGAGTTVAAGGIRCPLCGQPTGHNLGGCTVCPIGRWGCGTLTCSHCGYRFVAEGKWLARLERWRGALAAWFGRGGRAKPVLARALPTLADLSAGESASVEEMGSEHAARLARLSAYGMVPGSHLRVIQTRPAILVEVDGTRLALESEIAGGIQVRRLGS